MKYLRLFENSSEISIFIQKEYQKYNDSVEDKFKALNTNITDKNLIIFSDKIVVVTEDFYKHMESHNEPTKEIGGAPGSYFTVNSEEAKQCIKKALENKEDSVFPGQKPKLDTYIWRQVDCGSPIGVSVVQHDQELKEVVSQVDFPSETEVRSSDSGIIDRFIKSLKSCELPDGYKKYFYMRGNIEEGMVIKNDDVMPTKNVTVVCGKLTEYENKPVFLIYTAYPDEKGGPNGHTIPNSRMLFPQNGFYFSVSDEFYNKVESEIKKTSENKSHTYYKYLKSFNKFIT
jgi:hypothetical protein